MENVVSLQLEVDSAASHYIISKTGFEEFQASLLQHGKEKSKSLPRGVKIKLADGSIASQECKVVQINVSRDLSNFNESFPLTFLVVTGPNNLIGRHSLERLWPREFKAFKNVTGKNVCQPKVSQTNTCVKEPVTNSDNSNDAIINSCTSASKCKNKSSSSKCKNKNSRSPKIRTLIFLM